MVELKKKEAECLEAPQERGNATSPGSHPCVRDEGREREGTHYQSEDTARLPKHRRVLFMVPHAVFLSALLASTPIPSNSLLFSIVFHIQRWTVNLSESILVPLSNSLASCWLVCEGVLIFKNRATPEQLQWSDLSSSITLRLLHHFWKLTSV